MFSGRTLNKKHTNKTCMVRIYILTGEVNTAAIAEEVLEEGEEEGDKDWSLPDLTEGVYNSKDNNVGVVSVCGCGLIPRVLRKQYWQFSCVYRWLLELFH